MLFVRAYPRETQEMPASGGEKGQVENQVGLVALQIETVLADGPLRYPLDRRSASHSRPMSVRKFLSFRTAMSSPVISNMH
jgi:hypothetical protein